MDLSYVPFRYRIVPVAMWRQRLPRRSSAEGLLAMTEQKLRQIDEIGRLQLNIADALDTIKCDHDRGLAQVEVLFDSLQDEDVMASKRHLIEFLRFVQDELPRHFRFEEEVLFPLVQGALAGPGPIELITGTPDICDNMFALCATLCQMYGPLSVYKNDHRIIRECIDKFRLQVRHLDRRRLTGDRGTLIIHAAKELGFNLGSHIARENEALLPKAKEILLVS
ncbi:MAG: hemerythrin domain-containing protein [Chloroflexi bacterium]|nr:hemerythrin domain-containing protein [Chloroflexota bacterium]